MDWANHGLCENYNIPYPNEWGTLRVDSPYQRNLPRGSTLSLSIFPMYRRPTWAYTAGNKSKRYKRAPPYVVED